VKSIKLLKTTIADFFSYYPAWAYSLSGLFFLLIPTSLRLILATLLIFKNTRRFAVFGLVCSFLSSFHAKPLELTDGTHLIEGLFTPQKEISNPSFFAETKFIEGILKTEEKKYKIKLLKKDDMDFLTQKTWVKLNIESKDGFPKLSVICWKKIGDTPQLFKFRKNIKTALKNITSVNGVYESQTLLFALLTGTIEQKLLRLQFQSHGLAHILSLSGFHLNLLMSFSQFIFRKVFRFKYAPFMGLGSLSVYVLFLGAQCSVIRAFTQICFSEISKFRFFSSDVLHIYSLALIITSLICYEQIASPGFILTFVATLALISFRQLWQSILNLVGNAENAWEKLIYGWMKLLFLQIYVFLISLPVVLHFFEHVNLSSLFFNLFYPFLIGIFMIFGCVIIIIRGCDECIGSYLLTKLYVCNDYALELIKKPPHGKNNIIELQVDQLSMVLCLVLFLILVFSLFMKKKQVT
jgi:ComEC/Rec2-related protein